MRNNFFNGRIYTTVGITNLLTEKGLDNTKILECLGRHLSNDDDNGYEEDRKYNELAIKNNEGRVLSVYNILGKKIYIITQGLHLPFNDENRYTTIMLADEY